MDLRPGRIPNPVVGASAGQCEMLDHRARLGLADEFSTEFLPEQHGCKTTQQKRDPFHMLLSNRLPGLSIGSDGAVHSLALAPQGSTEVCVTRWTEARFRLPSQRGLAYAPST